jgi:hypothetical protein
MALHVIVYGISFRVSEKQADRSVPVSFHESAADHSFLFCRVFFCLRYRLRLNHFPGGRFDSVQSELLRKVIIFLTLFFIKGCDLKTGLYLG